MKFSDRNFSEKMFQNKNPKDLKAEKALRYMWAAKPSQKERFSNLFPFWDLFNPNLIHQPLLPQKKLKDTGEATQTPQNRF